MIQIDKAMPQSCYYCPCTNDGFYMCLLADKQLEDNCEDSRPTWCPLHEYTDTDTISRKQAIDAVDTITKWSLLDRNGCHVGVGMKYRDVKETVNSLPPSPSIKPDTDTISRQAVIELIQGSICDLEYSDENRELCNKVRALPPSPSRPPWIPCSERLPEDKQEVLVTEYGDTDIGRRFEGRWLDRYGDKMKDVTAWMPKPVPYAERRTE